jgi:hypothetical protein
MRRRAVQKALQMPKAAGSESACTSVKQRLRLCSPCATTVPRARSTPYLLIPQIPLQAFTQLMYGRLLLLRCHFVWRDITGSGALGGGGKRAPHVPCACQSSSHPGSQHGPSLCAIRPLSRTYGVMPIYIGICACICVRIYVRASICVSICIHTNTHTHTRHTTSHIFK